MVCAFLAVFFAERSARATPPTDCKTPRSAVDSVFAWQQPDNSSLELAARCLDPDGRSTDELRGVAKAIKSVYDHRSAFVKMEKIPDVADYKNDKGASRVVVHDALPEVFVVKSMDGDWLWSKASLDKVEALHYSDTAAARVDKQWIEKIPASLRGKVLDVEIWQYLAIILLFVVGLVVRRVIAFVVKNRVRSLVHKLGQTWAETVVDVFASPGATLIMAVLLRLFYPRLLLPIHAAVVMQVAVRVLIVLSIVWAAYRIVDVIAARMAFRAAESESKLDDQLVPLVRKALKVVTVIIGGLFVLQNLNVNVSSLLAGLGIGGLAFALAAKDTLANFFGSVMIFIDRPFQVGDWVVIGPAEGIVEEVGFRSTRVRTFYNSLMTIPNAKLMDTSIDNYGEREFRRCFITLGVTYDTTPEQMQAFVEGIRAIIQANPKTRKDYFEVHMSGFGAHSLDIMVYFFFKVASWTEELTERHNIYLEFMRLAQHLGVAFAFPTRTLHVPEVAKPGDEYRVAPPPGNERLIEVIEGFGPKGQLGRPGGPRLSHGYMPGEATSRGSDGEAS